MAKKPLFEKLILHIGTHKTGTSAIQKWLHDSQDQLLKQGLFYPETGQWADRSHHAWSSVLWQMQKDSNTKQLDDLIKRLKAEHKNLSKSAQADTILISSELMEKLATSPDGQKVLELFLGTIAKETHVVVFLRRQDDLMESVFKQWVKDTKLRLHQPPRVFLEQQKHTADYYQIIKHWQNIKGVTDITVRTNIFERGPILNFMEALNIKDITIDTDRKSKIINPSLDGLALEFKHFTNHLNLSIDEDAILQKRLFKIPLPKEKLSLFDEESRKAYVDHFAESNNNLYKEFSADPFTKKTSHHDRSFKRISGADLYKTMELLKTIDEKIVWRICDNMRIATERASNITVYDDYASEKFDGLMKHISSKY